MCTTSGGARPCGCLTYFRIGHINDSGLLPEKFKKEPAADAE